MLSGNAKVVQPVTTKPHLLIQHQDLQKQHIPSQPASPSDSLGGDVEPQQPVYSSRPIFKRPREPGPEFQQDRKRYKLSPTKRDEELLELQEDMSLQFSTHVEATAELILTKAKLYNQVETKQSLQTNGTLTRIHTHNHGKPSIAIKVCPPTESTRTCLCSEETSDNINCRALYQKLTNTTPRGPRKVPLVMAKKSIRRNDRQLILVESEITAGTFIERVHGIFTTRVKPIEHALQKHTVVIHDGLLFIMGKPWQRGLKSGRSTSRVNDSSENSSSANTKLKLIYQEGNPIPVVGLFAARNLRRHEALRVNKYEYTLLGC